MKNWIISLNMAIATHTKKVEYGLFILVCIVFSIVTLYIGSLDHKSKVTEPEFALPYPVVHSDSMMYGLLATRILNGEMYSTTFEPPLVPEISWAPGYPLLIAISLFLFGSTIPLIILQIILGGVTAVLIFRIARLFIPPLIALIPALIFALDLSIAYYTSTAHTDGMFMCLTTLLVYLLFFKQHRSYSIFGFMLLGILLGYISLIRTVGQYLIIVIPILYLVREYLAHTFSKRSVLAMSLFVFTAILTLTPWAQRNHEIFGHYSVGNVGPQVLLTYYVVDFLVLKSLDSTVDDFTHTTRSEEVDMEIKAELDALVKEKGGIRETYYGEVALRHIFADPFGYAKFHLIGNMPYFLAGSYRHFFVSTVGFFQDRAGLPHTEHTNISHAMISVLFSGSPAEILATLKSLSIVILEICWRILLLVLALCALGTRDRNTRIAVILLWTLVAYFAFLTGPIALTRYRIVSEPLYLILVGVGIYTAYGYLKILYRRFKTLRS